MTDIYHQYNQISDTNTASPLGSSQHQQLAVDKSTQSQIRVLTSQVSVLSRELERTRARLRDLESNLDSVVSTLRRRDG
jgi:hypothetical protein